MNTDPTTTRSGAPARSRSRARKVVAVAGLTTVLGLLGAGAAMAQPNNGGTGTPKNCTLGGKTYSPGAVVSNPKLRKSWVCDISGHWAPLPRLVGGTVVAVDLSRAVTATVAAG